MAIQSIAGSAALNQTIVVDTSSPASQRGVHNQRAKMAQTIEQLNESQKEKVGLGRLYLQQKEHKPRVTNTQRLINTLFV
jgi:3-deoxy-D-arabino-heptulosonate 7-phosphate (DAHP) synthase